MRGSFHLLITHGANLTNVNASLFKINSCRDNIIASFPYKILDLLWNREAPQTIPRMLGSIRARGKRRGSGEIASELDREGTLLIKMPNHFIPNLTSAKRNF